MIGRLMNKTLQVYTLQRTSDGQGGFAESYVQTATVVGRVSAGGAKERTKERTIAGSISAEVTHTVYTLTPLQRGNRLVVDGMVLEVLAVSNPSLMAHHYEHDCKEIQVENA